MALPQTSQVIPVPIPIKGLNWRDPLAAMDPQYSPYIVGVEPEPQYLRMRNGWTIHATLTDATSVLGLGMFGNSALFAYAQHSGGGAVNRIYNVTAAGAQAAAAAVHACGTNVADEAYVVKFNRRTAFVGETDYTNCARVWNGSTWAAWAFTLSGTVQGARTVLSHKGRTYMFGGAVMIYSDLTGVMGACTSIDLTTLFEESDEICWAGRLTHPSGSENEALLAFGNAAGEILVYAGDNPAAANWQLVGRFKVGRPLFYNAALEYNNDIWICCETGIVSLRRLFTAGDGNADAVTVTSAINPYWTALMSAIKNASPSVGLFNSQCSIAYWPEQNKIAVLVNGAINVDSAFTAEWSTLFVHNTVSGAWIPQLLINPVHTTYPPRALTYFNNGLYYATGKYILKQTTGYKEEYVSGGGGPGNYSGVSGLINSAYLDWRSQGRTARLGGFDAIVKADIGAASLAVWADFGQKYSAVTSNVLPSGYSRPFFSVGIDGAFVKYVLMFDSVSALSATTGFNLYSMGAVIS